MATELIDQINNCSNLEELGWVRSYVHQITSRLSERETELTKLITVKCGNYNIRDGTKYYFVPQGGCEKEFPIGELEYIRTHWYTEPYSCNGGDYWNEGEGQFICPECGLKNRFIDEERKFLKTKQYQFKSIRDTHER